MCVCVCVCVCVCGVCVCVGCPFRHWDEAHIRQMLTSHGISHKGIATVTSYVKDNHYQLACQKYYEITHAVSYCLDDIHSPPHPS